VERRPRQRGHDHAGGDEVLLVADDDLERVALVEQDGSSPWLRSTRNRRSRNRNAKPSELKGRGK
jgi:hypothetical protein